MNEEAFVSVEVDGVPVLVALVLEDVGGLWSAQAAIPATVTPRANVSIRGAGVGRERAIADAMEKIRDAVDRYAPARRAVREEARRQSGRGRGGAL